MFSLVMPQIQLNSDNSNTQKNKNLFELSNVRFIESWPETPRGLLLWRKVDIEMAKNHKVNMFDWFLDF